MEQKFRGVKKTDHAWLAQIGYLGKPVHLGSFKSFDEAKAARLEAEVRLFGAVFDRREIDFHEDHAKIPLHGRGGVFHGWAMVDLGDIDLLGGIAWTLDGRGYVVGRPAGFKSPITLHRWLMVGSQKVGFAVDHIDRDKLNNRRANLRFCTQSQNTKNTSLAQSNTSGAKGVSRDVNGRWRARIWKDRVEIHLGTFSTVEDARAAYDRAAIELHGDFASPNMAETVEPSA